MDDILEITEYARPRFGLILVRALGFWRLLPRLPYILIDDATSAAHRHLTSRMEKGRKKSLYISTRCVRFGGDDPQVYDKAKKDGALNELPTNHNPRFAPVIHPTLETGVKALVLAAHDWLAS